MKRSAPCAPRSEKNLYGAGTCFTGADANGVLNIDDEDLPIANPPRLVSIAFSTVIPAISWTNALGYFSH
jgi:hypothetical protein